MNQSIRSEKTWEDRKWSGPFPWTSRGRILRIFRNRVQFLSTRKFL